MHAMTIKQAHSITGNNDHICYKNFFMGTSHPCSNFSDLRTKESTGHVFVVCIHTENHNQVGLYHFVLYETQPVYN